MALDGLFLFCLINELNEKLCGARVDKIYQPSAHELLFCFRKGREQYKLMASASGTSPSLRLTEIKLENPEKPPNFTMLMRKNLMGAILTKIRQHHTDRIAFLDFDAVNEIGDQVKRVLVIEIMAQYSNIILLNEENRIIDSIRRVDPSRSSFRQILPGLSYIFPPAQGKPSLLYDDLQGIVNQIFEKDISQIDKAILNSIEGVSPVLSREIAARLPEKSKSALYSVLSELKFNILSNQLNRNAVFDSDGKPKEFSFLELKQYAGFPAKSYDTLSSLLEEFYGQREILARSKAKAENLYKLVDNLCERYSKKLSEQQLELAAATEREEKRIFGDLIQANLYRLEKGVFYYDIENFYDDLKIVRIPADPRKTPAQNAQKYYKEYRRAANAEVNLNREIAKAKTDLDYLLSVRDNLLRANTEIEFSAIREELIETGFLRLKSTDKVKRRQKALPTFDFQSPNGFKVSVGRNNLQNDQLTFRTASKNDIWFHVQKFHGSHVILFTEGGSPKPEDYFFAAKKAVENSEVSGETKIAVDYTEVRQIKKPTGAKPGFVIYHTYKTMIV